METYFFPETFFSFLFEIGEGDSTPTFFEPQTSKGGGKLFENTIYYPPQNKCLDVAALNHSFLRLTKGLRN